jgi:cardiolipin synthase
MLFTIASSVALIIVIVLLLLVLFEPGLNYSINSPLPGLETNQFLLLLSSLAEAAICEVSEFTVLRNGEFFYEAEIIAIQSARASVHLEAFIFHDTPIGHQFRNALAERASAGVRVRLVVDAVGSMLTADEFFEPLREAGADVVWYQPLRWYTLKRFNNRTHRELLVIDGDQAFIGGAGISSAWDTGDSHQAPWRDTVVRIRGGAVTRLQAVFVENWLESSGEILADETAFPDVSQHMHSAQPNYHLSVVVGSSPTGGRATRARILFQVLVAAARKTIRVNSLYFLPDTAMRRELIQAARKGVEVTIITPGLYNNHPMTRHASRQCYGELLEAGIRIFEYRPGMIHAKILIVDNLWSVVGSTNFDNRSFGLNDEVNIAIRDEGLAQILVDDFETDFDRSDQVTLAAWRRRSGGDRLIGAVSSILQRQQ